MLGEELGVSSEECRFQGQFEWKLRSFNVGGSPVERALVSGAWCQGGSWLVHMCGSLSGCVHSQSALLSLCSLVR